MDIVSAPDGELREADAERVLRLLLADELLIYPTDTLYALGGRALSPRAVARVRTAKLREQGKPLPVVAADRDQVRDLCAAFPKTAEKLMDAFWPGPLTLVLPARDSVPSAVTAGAGTIGVRIPASPLTRRLCALAGPLVSSSANTAGEAPPLDCASAVSAVGGAAALAIDAGPGTPLASTIVDLTGESPTLLRAGAVAWEQVLRVL